MAKLQKEFNEATLDARRRVGDVIGSAMRAFDDPKLTNALVAGRLCMHVCVSFLLPDRRLGPFLCRTATKSVSMLRQLPQDVVGASALSVKVNAFAPNPPDPMLRADIDDIESLRSNKESDMFESVRGRFSCIACWLSGLAVEGARRLEGSLELRNERARGAHESGRACVKA